MRLRVRWIISFVLILLTNVASAQRNEKEASFLKHVQQIDNKGTNFKALLPNITKPGTTPDEKLQLAYFWIYTHITFDVKSFLTNGPLQPQTSAQTLKTGKGLCLEYNQLFTEACDYLNIPGYNVEGYVKFYGFKAGDKFTQRNHIWRAVYLNHHWLLADLLWASGTLIVTDSGNYKFKPSLQQQFFLAEPDFFLHTHLPADPVWQFASHPLKINGFTVKASGIDSNLRDSFQNWADSIAAMRKLSPEANEIRAMQRAYRFNPADVDDPIITYYNQAVQLINLPGTPKAELIRARTYFDKAVQLIAKTSNKDLKALLPVCKRGAATANKRLLSGN